MKLLEATRMGDLVLKNRMAMAPMTRSRANSDGTVKDMTATYYKQRSDAGLLISEAVNISEQAIGSPLTPGIYTQAHVEAWRKVTDAVHQSGGKIFIQLWHTGRVGHSVDKNGMQTVAPSAIAIEGQKHFTTQGPKDYETPRALETEEVKAIVQDYAAAARRAKEAGFDGVELHGAFGYLPNQFLVDGANKRTDEYGGDIAARSRFVLEVMAALTEVWGPDKVGIKLSPSIPFNGMIDSDPKALFGYLITELNKLPLAYVHLMNALFPLDHLPHWPKEVLKTFRPMSRHIIMANGGYTRETGESALLAGDADLISYGALYLTNPDLARRFELNSQIFNTPDRATMYGGGEHGYTDYPFLEK